MPVPVAKSKTIVHVLPDALADQIAAGEVVERPASVVKELVENAIDAGATSIEVSISPTARDLSVADDGVGMVRDDAVTALKRFATSKIAALDDLHAIGTFGFRGEALPSIASVSRFTLETRPSADDVGTRIEVLGGTMRDVKPASCPPGTKVTVEDLFFNTPARLKFLKTPPTEIRHAVQAVSRVALAATGVGFTVTAAGKVALRIAPAASLVERVGAALGTDVARGCFAIDGRSGPVRVRGFAGSPALARSNARDLMIYVNGRVVRERTAQAAAIEAYRSLLPKERFPVALLLLEVPPDLVDVNVHPAKTEVRFAKSDDVWRAVHRAVEQALREAPWARSTDAIRVPTAVPETLPLAAAPAPLEAAVSSEAVRSYVLRRPLVEEPPVVAAGPATAGDERDDDPRRFFRGLRVFGQYKSTYLLAEKNGELVVIDQHAAHERVMFEKLKLAAAAGEIPVQRLLVPAVVELSAAEAREATAVLPALAKAGLEAEPFGDRAVAIRGVPAALARVEPARLLRDALDEVARHGRSETMLDRLDDVFARMACHAAVRAGDRLSSEEVARLLEQMDGIDFAANCPHGRPVIVRFPAAEVEKWFDRR